MLNFGIKHVDKGQISTVKTNVQNVSLVMSSGWKFNPLMPTSLIPNLNTSFFTVAFLFRFLVRVSYLEIYNESVRDLLGKDQTATLEVGN